MRYSANIDNLTTRIVALLLFAYPTLVFIGVRDSVTICFAILIIMSFLFFFHSKTRHVFALQQGDINFAIAMTSLTGAVLISDAFHGSFRLASLDTSSRFFFAVPIYLMLRHVSFAAARPLQYGLPLGALAGLLASIFFPSHIWPAGTYFIDSLRFGGASLMLGILSAATINWTRKDSPAVLALKLVGLATGVYCAIHSDARGAWIAIPVLTFIWTHYYLRGYRGAKYVAVAALLFVAVAGYQLVPQVRNRIAVTQAEVVSVFTGHLNTSIGLRLQIWNAALHLIRDNPIAGVGPAGLPDALRAFHERGGIDDFALELAIGEMHNEILAHTTRFGIFGLLSILAIYLVPLTLFAAATSSSDHVKRNAGVMGVLFAVGYFIYGLTLETFAMKPFATFYAMTVACLLAIARQSVPQMAGSTNFGADTQRGLA